MRDLIGYLTLLMGASISLLNFYCSWIRMPLLRALGRSPRWVSGFPIVGSLLLLIALFLFWDHRGLAVAAALLVAIDTGGPHWYLGGQLWRSVKNPANRP